MYFEVTFKNKMPEIDQKMNDFFKNMKLFRRNMRKFQTHFRKYEELSWIVPPTRNQGPNNNTHSVSNMRKFQKHFRKYQEYSGIVPPTRNMSPNNTHSVHIKSKNTDVPSNNGNKERSHRRKRDESNSMRQEFKPKDRIKRPRKFKVRQ